MFRHRWLYLLHSFGLEFWLPLPFLGVLFWFGGNLMTEHVLSRPYTTVNQLQADTQLEVKLSLTVVLIQAVINKTEGVTFVAVKTTDSTLKKLEYEFGVTEVSEVESAIAQELNMSIEQTRKLVRYQIQD
ncbi:MAG TPA: hypothetical protein DCY88_18935 [Cyanobacteria bacterium UBA11372]|nr:hypothetical protein [Cyanobacteria bacterium UBA11372]HBE35256.1 hypothetical protein [Cyanobacteria bacterium UBA11368]